MSERVKIDQLAILSLPLVPLQRDRGLHVRDSHEQALTSNNPTTLQASSTPF